MKDKFQDITYKWVNLFMLELKLSQITWFLEGDINAKMFLKQTKNINDNLFVQKKLISRSSVRQGLCCEARPKKIVPAEK